jgi:hypothetical protein
LDELNDKGLVRFLRERSLVRKWLEWTPLGQLYTVTDWLQALRHPVAQVGAVLGVVCLSLLIVIDGFSPREGPLLLTVTSAFVGTIWTIWVYFGYQNGYQRSIAMGMLFWVALFLAVADEFPLFQRLLSGAAMGGLSGAIWPLAWLRLRSRWDGWWPRRRLALALAAPQVHLLQESGATLVADCEPYEARATLTSSWDCPNREAYLDNLLRLVEQGHQQGYRQRHPDGPLIRGWDLGRAVQFVRWGLVSCYLSRSQACAWADRIAAQTISEFTSWDEYAASYQRGAEFWCGGDPHSTARFQDAVEWARQKVWKKLKWPAG